MKALKLVLTMVICMFFYNVVYAENQIILKGGYHLWTDSGWTFAYSDVSDKEFNGAAYALEYAYYPDPRWGISLQYLRHNEVQKEIFPGWNFTCNTEALVIMPKYRFKKILANTDLVLGVGINLYHNQLQYHDQQESMTGLGASGGASLVYHINPEWELVMETQYNWNKQKSSVYYDTNWSTGGTYVFMGIGYKF